MNDERVRNELEEQSSLFVSTAGILVLFALFLTAACQQAALLTVILFFAFLTALTSRLWGHFSLRRLCLFLDGTSCRTFPGSPVSFDVRISNEKMLPLLWLETVLPSPPEGMFDMRESHVGRFTWLMPHQTLAWKCEWKGIRRGIYRIPQVTLLSGDGFGLSVQSEDRTPENLLTFVVYPQVFPVNTNPFLRLTSEVSYGSRGYQEDLTLLKNIRGYRPGDPGKKINWRMLARTQKLNVNLYEEILPKSVTFLIDLLSFAEYKSFEKDGGTVEILDKTHLEELEEMLSLTASCILALSEKKAQMGLVLPMIGYREHTEIRKRLPGDTLIFPNEPEEMVPELLTALSGISYSGEKRFFDNREISAASGRMGEIFVTAYSPETLSCLKTLDVFPENRVSLLVFDKKDKPGMFRRYSLAELKKER